jgi:hypothetical protein
MRGCKLGTKGLKIGVGMDEKYNYIIFSHIDTGNLENGMKETLASYITMIH